MFNAVLSRRTAVFVAVGAVLWLTPLPVSLPTLLGRLVLVYAVASTAARLLSPYIPRPDLPGLHERSVLITGCSSGFGLDAALALDRLGVPVLATCRNPNAPAVIDLKKKASSKLKIVQMDVASDESVTAAAKKVREILGDKQLWAVVNNAGVLPMGEGLFMDEQELRYSIEVNAIGHMRVVRAFFPWLRKSKGRVVNVISLGCRITVGGLTPDLISKYAAWSLANGFRVELRRFGISVHNIDPYIYKTRLTEGRNDQIDKCWKNVSEEMKAVYGHDYDKKLKGAGDFLSHFFYPESKVYLITDAIVDACVAKDPQDRYVPSLMGTVVEVVAGYCPWIVDILHIFILPKIKS